MKITNARVWSGASTLELRDIGVDGTRFVDPARLDPRDTVIDAEGLVALPGLITRMCTFVWMAARTACLA